jgi:hypothetical protein
LGQSKNHWVVGKDRNYKSIGQICKICKMVYSVNDDIQCGPRGRPHSSWIEWVYVLPGPCAHLAFHPCNYIGGCGKCDDITGGCQYTEMEDKLELAIVRWESSYWWLPFWGRWVSDTFDDEYAVVRKQFKE